MNGKCRIAEALRDVADMVDELNLGVGLDVHVNNTGTHVSITPGEQRRPAKDIRPILDAIAAYVGVRLESSHSRGQFWHIGTPIWERGRLPSGATVSIYQTVRGRPLDLAPLPERKRRAAATS